MVFSPSRKVGEQDNRTSHVWVATYWARALADQDDDPEIAARFAPLADRLEAAVEDIAAELDQVQGDPVELDGYYRIDRDKADQAMRPSAAFNEILASLA